jgi:hypothetical protein
LRDLLRAEPPSHLVLPAADDENPDHWATHLFGASAAAQEALGSRPQIQTYLVHHEGWPGGFRWAGNDRLQPPRDLPPHRWTTLLLKPAERAAKRAALEAYASQTAVMGSRLRRFDRPNELFGDVATPPLPEGGMRRPQPVPGGELIVGRQEERFTAQLRLKGGDWTGARFHVHVLTAGGKVRWEFRSGAPAPPGCESRRRAPDTWEVSVPLPPAAARIEGIWVGAERYPPGGPPENLGWSFYEPARPPQSKITPSAAERSRARAA